MTTEKGGRPSRAQEAERLDREVASLDRTLAAELLRACRDKKASPAVRVQSLQALTQLAARIRGPEAETPSADLFEDLRPRPLRLSDRMIGALLHHATRQSEAIAAEVERARALRAELDALLATLGLVKAFAEFRHHEEVERRTLEAFAAKVEAAHTSQTDSRSGPSTVAPPTAEGVADPVESSQAEEAAPIVDPDPLRGEVEVPISEWQRLRRERGTE